MLYKAVIFDLDGTLVDTLNDIVSAVNITFEHFGYPSKSVDEVKNAINNSSARMLYHLMPEKSSEKDLAECYKKYNEIYMKYFSQKAVQYEGIGEILKKLRLLKVRVNILSNKDDALVKKIVANAFENNLFDEVVGKGKLPPKPDPSSALGIAYKLNLRSRDFIFVGDTTIDAATAKNAGMQFIGVSWGYRSREELAKCGAKIIVNKPSEILQYVINGRKSDNSYSVNDRI